ncbi:hypothetical protein AB0D63_39430 [Kitasatospora sp. NPDC048343]|uniref:hypothetical protein n=1 Tax=Kitasatospora sp. NPDC048343 TaxID=3154717 RepID=UPI0033C0CF6A
MVATQAYRITPPKSGAPSQPQNQSHDHQIAAWWNFIGRTNEEIAQTRADWQSGTRFGEVHGYARARLPAPKLPDATEAAGPRALSWRR